MGYSAPGVVWTGAARALLARCLLLGLDISRVEFL